jgi:hypothetical protein
VCAEGFHSLIARQTITNRGHRGAVVFKHTCSAHSRRPERLISVRLRYLASGSFRLILLPQFQFHRHARRADAKSTKSIARSTSSPLSVSNSCNHGKGYEPLFLFLALNGLYYGAFFVALGLLYGFELSGSGVSSNLGYFLWGHV